MKARTLKTNLQTTFEMETGIRASDENFITTKVLKGKMETKNSQCLNYTVQISKHHPYINGLNPKRLEKPIP